MSLLSTQQSIQAFYLSLFGRAADPEGFNYWVSQVNSGRLELNDVLAAMFQSDEFAERRSELFTNEGDDWVGEVYQDFFGREADAEGASYWSSLLTSGVPPQELISRIIMSASPSDKEALDATTSIARFYSENVSNAEYDAN